MTPELNKIYQGDCLEIMRGWPDGFIDCIVTSPPYNLGMKKKGSFYASRQGKSDAIEYADHSDDMESGDYVEWQKEVILEMRRIIKPDGAIFYNHKPRIDGGVYDDRRRLIPIPIRQEIVWDRCCMVNFSGSFFAPQSERIFVIAGPEWKPRRDSVGYGDIWRFSPEKNNPHPAPFPLGLAKRIVESATDAGDIVFDPYMGSGTTALAALSLGRNYLGTELTKEYIEMANAKIAAESSQGKLF